MRTILDVVELVCLAQIAHLLLLEHYVGRLGAILVENRYECCRLGRCTVPGHVVGLAHLAHELARPDHRVDIRMLLDDAGFFWLDLGSQVLRLRLLYDRSLHILGDDERRRYHILNR